MANFEHAVEELQGLYGPFTMHERIVQKVWLQGDFDASRATLLDGRRLEIVAPGKWNRLGGPDFCGAVLRIDGREVRGDIEVHFRASDWVAHGHAANPAFGNVVLHVVLFPPDFPECAARRYDDALLPTLVLLPLLHRDLEEYAADDALETLTARDDWRRFAELADRPLEEAVSALAELGRARWRRKVAFMQTRIARLGFAEAAHHTALEILGYRRNRVPMLAAATRWPLPEWGREDVAGRVYAELEGQWNRHGVRPANQPRARLMQYARWVRQRPDWTAQLARWGAVLGEAVPPAVAETPCARREWRFKDVARKMDDEIVAGTVGGSRFHTLVCDGLLPLASAHAGRDLGGWWLHWYPGDVPESLTRALARLGISGGVGKPHSQGMHQGLLGWLIERDR